MTQRIVALAGISGVGKSFLLNGLRREIPMQVFQASALIKLAREASEKVPLTLDQLRAENLDENQKLLVQGFAKAMKPTPTLVLFDCHTVIERGDELVRIDPVIFKGIGIEKMAFLTEDPTIIQRRRTNDTTRTRPLVAVEVLQLIQDQALSHARYICDVLGVPFAEFNSSKDKAALFDMLQTIDPRPQA